MNSSYDQGGRADARDAAVGFAVVAAQAVRELNHATITAGTGYAHPMDVTVTLTELAALVCRLPQALSQASGWLTTEHSAGRLGQDGATPAGVLLDQTGAALSDASVLCDRLAGLLRAGCGHTAHLTATHSPTRPEHQQGTR
jgi:hypothetical protein